MKCTACISMFFSQSKCAYHDVPLCPCRAKALVAFTVRLVCSCFLKMTQHTLFTGYTWRRHIHSIPKRWSLLQEKTHADGHTYCSQTHVHTCSGWRLGHNLLETRLAGLLCTIQWTLNSFFLLPSMFISKSCTIQCAGCFLLYIFLLTAFTRLCPTMPLLHKD